MHPKIVEARRTWRRTSTILGCIFFNGDPEEFFLFVHNFNMTISSSGMMDMGVKIQYICTLVHGESLRQFDLLSADV